MTVPKTAQIDFDVAALFDALDVQRRERGPELARRLPEKCGICPQRSTLSSSELSLWMVAGRSGTL